jgi:hypothetical protein
MGEEKMATKKFIGLKVVVIRQTTGDKSAVLVQLENGRKQWIPRSLVEPQHPELNKPITLNIADWFCIDKKLTTKERKWNHFAQTITLDCECVAQRAEAIQVEIVGDEPQVDEHINPHYEPNYRETRRRWIPDWTIDEETQVWKEGQAGFLIISAKFAYENGLSHLSISDHDDLDDEQDQDQNSDEYLSQAENDNHPRIVAFDHYNYGAEEEEDQLD